MDRRSVLAGGAAAGWLAATAAQARRAPDAAAIHRRALVLDSHVDVLLPGTERRSYAADGRSRSELDKLRAGGVDALVYAVAVSTGPRTIEGYSAARVIADQKLAMIRAIAAGSAGQAEIALSAADVRAIVRRGHVAILIGFLNAYSLGEDLSAFDDFYASGVRVAGLAHAGNTVFADSSRPGAAGEEHHGLSPLGLQAVSRMNDLGVLIDVSQLTPAGVKQTLRRSRAPVAATHSAVRALVDSPRNLADAELEAIGARGGVVQVTPFNSYLVPRPAGYEEAVRGLRRSYGLDETQSGSQGAEALEEDRRTAFLAAYAGLYPRASVTTFVNHIDYIVRRIGIDHVGVGSDFNHGAGINGFDGEDQALNVTRELVARGYLEPQIDKIWGQNFLRVLAAAEAARRP